MSDLTAEPVRRATWREPASWRELRPDFVRVYVWEMPVRLTHWVIFLSIILLSVTGIYIGRPYLLSPGAAGSRFVMGTMKAIHSYSAIAFTLAVLSRILWLFLGNTYASWDNFVPASRSRRRGLWNSLKFYLFLTKYPPGHVGHNPLAGCTYIFVFLTYLTMIITGFALYSSGAAHGSPMRWFQFLIPVAGGLQTARLLHHIGMWLLIGFFVHHLYSAIFMAYIEGHGTMESIFSGYKFVPREQLVHIGPEYVDRLELEDADEREARLERERHAVTDV